MQQLHNASDSEKCARSVLETVLAVMVSIRESAARRHKNSGPSASLIHIRAMGVLRKRPGATLSAVSDQLALTLSATSRLVDGLVEQGLVRRLIPPGNRRTVSLMLTAAGNRRLEEAIRQSQQDLIPRLNTLTPQQRRQLAGSLELLRPLFDEPGAP